MNKKIDANKLIAMRKAGYSQQSVADVFNVTQGAVSMVERKLKKKPPDALIKKICKLSSKLSVEQVFELIDLYYHVKFFNKNGDRPEKIP